MLQYITTNIGTILISLALLAVVAGIIAVMRKDRKKGKSPCGCGGNCSHCPMSGSCRNR